MLHEFITLNRDKIVLRCRAKVATRSVPPAHRSGDQPRGTAVPRSTRDHASRRPGSAESRDFRSAVLHGHDLLGQGFTVSQVVHDYGDICQSVTELALEQDAPSVRMSFAL
jgi:hypothetical protein